MRSALVALALSMAACAAPTPAEVIASDRLCARLEEAITRGRLACCGASGPAADDLTGFVTGCSHLRALVDDPRVGLDGAAAAVIVDELEQRLATCDGAWLAWASSAEGLRNLYAGTRGLGTMCDVSTGMADAAGILSCVDGYCPTRTDELATAFVCAPFRREGTSCESDLECTPGLVCSASGTTLGACMTPHADGAGCGQGAECRSGYCASGRCSPTSTTRPETICAPAAPPPPTDRDVELVLDGFDVSPTRTVTLRVLDAAARQLTYFEAIGLATASSTHLIPRTVPTGMTAIAQITTVDPAAAAPEMRTWELPVAAEGPLTLAVAFSDPTTPLGAMPPGSIDALFELQLSSFDSELGKTFQLRLVNASGRTVGQVRLDTIPDLSFRIGIPDSVVPAVRYEFLMYVDENADGAYQPPPVDHAWRAYATAPGLGGLSLPYAWTSAYQDVAF